MRHEKRAGEVDLKDPTPVVGLEIDHGSRDSDAGDIGQDVQRAMAVHDFSYRGGTGLLNGHIANDAVLHFVEITADHGRTFVRQSFRYRGADAACCARHQCHFSCKSRHRVNRTWHTGNGSPSRRYPTTGHGVTATKIG